jgi:hypothetical protein
MIGIYENESGEAETRDGSPWRLTHTGVVTLAVTMTAGTFHLEQYDNVAEAWSDVVDGDGETIEFSSSLTQVLDGLPAATYRIVGTSVGAGDHVRVAASHRIEFPSPAP